MSSTLIVDKEISINSTQAEAKEVRMKKQFFTLNLKSKWVVGLAVLISLGLCGVNLTQPNVTSAQPITQTTTC